MEADNMKIKQIISLLLSVVMVLGMLSGCGNNQSEATDPKQNTAPSQTQENTEPVGTMEFDSTLESIRVVVDGVVHTFDVGVLDGAWYLSAKDATTAFGGNFTEDYVALDTYAKSENIRYIQDEVLTAAYINTWKPYEVHKWDVEFNIHDDGTDFERAFYMGLVDESLRDRADEQITSTEFREMLAGLVSKFAPDKLVDFDANVLDADLPLTRSDGILMAYYAAVCLGVDSYNVGFDSNIAYPNGWNEADATLFPNWNNGPAAYRWEGSDTDEYWDCEYDAALFWAIGHRSTVSSTLMFTLDEETGGMNIDAPLTIWDAVSVLGRIYDEAGKNYFGELSPDLLTTPSPILSDVHIAKANDGPIVTAGNHPKWTGFALDWGGQNSFFINVSEDNIYHIANWGFNSLRINLNHRNIFNTDGDIYTVNLANLQKLDSMIAAAIECGIHVDICLTTQPGREAYRLENYETYGDFDLFLNPEKQEKALWIWEALAARYKDIPSSYLSFSPIWEALNYALTTMKEVEEYSMADVGAFLAKAIDVIRRQDEDRLITYELCGGDRSLDKPIIDAVADKENILANYNFVDENFVYYQMCVPETGRDGDNQNHSMAPAVYPTYLYSTCRFIKQDDSIKIDGCLPAGTEINLYLKESFGSEFEIIADGEVLYSGELPASSYSIDYRRSVFNLYAQSDKCVSVTLGKDTDNVILSASGDGVEWSGMDIILPDEYARDYWWFNSPYDQFLGLTDTYGMTIRHDALITIAPTQDGLGVGAPPDDQTGRNITIHEDATYTTDVLWREASADTLESQLSYYEPVGGNAIVRFESANFAGVAWEDMEEYYNDLLTTFEHHDMSWWSNDFPGITNKMHSIGGAEYVEYGEFVSFNVEFLKLLQKHQNTERP